MQQRSEPHDSLDDFPTPPWATRALLQWLKGQGYALDNMSCREPAANRGHMVRPLAEEFDEVLPSDVHDYGVGYQQRDYLFGFDADILHTDWTITNPPFRLAEQFIERALATSRIGVAVILRSAFLESIGRFERLFFQSPPSDVLQFVERVAMVKGRLDEYASSATAYAWLVWRKDAPRNSFARLHWIAPCRDQLERQGDYPVDEDAPGEPTFCPLLTALGDERFVA
jgi:hypothetical protein